ncbi:MAG: class IV adenylate cyclase [Thermoplasmata archaeon]|nr:class IV adenylate cyclase [Thermoplasmata archaeon]
MRETEVKVLEIDRERVIATLDRLGAELIFDGMMRAVFLDFPGRSIINAGNLLRVRAEGNRSVMTFKGFVGRRGAKVMDELEVEVSDHATAVAILEGIGLEVIEEMEKQRTSYSLKGAHVDIDRYVGLHAHIPVFLEIEAVDVETIARLAEELGFEEEALLPWSTRDLLDHYADRT